MNKVFLKGLPEKRAADYDIGDGKFARVLYIPQETGSDRNVIEAQAFQVDADGKFVATATGYPSRTSGSKHTIQISALGDTSTLVAGWVRVVGDYSTTPEGAQRALPENAWLEERPKKPAIGDHAYVDNTLYRYDGGMLESIMQGKAEELQRLLRSSEALAIFTL